MNPQFYVARPGDTQRQGPFTREQLEQGLHSGQFAPGDLAWQTGTADWIPLSTLLMPALPEMPPLPPGMPAMPPLPTFSASGQAVTTLHGYVPPPPPPPLEGGSAPVPPPPAYASETRAPWSPLGLIGFIFSFAGLGLAAWFLFDLWQKYPATRPPMFREGTASAIVAGFGIVALLAAFAQLGSKRPQRGRGWAVAAVVLGGLVAVAGISGAAFASSWAEIRYEDEETSARQDMIGLGRYAREYADAHGGRFPNTIEELRTNQNAELQLAYFYEKASSSRSVQITPGLTVNSPGDTILLVDTWSSGRGRRAMYNVRGETTTQALTTPVSGAPALATPNLLTSAPSAPALGGLDLSTPEKCINTLVAAGRRGDVAGVRRCMTEKGFSREFSSATPDGFRQEFQELSFRVKSTGQPMVDASGQTTVKVILSVTENGKANDDTATFVQRGQEWLLDAI